MIPIKTKMKRKNLIFEFISKSIWANKWCAMKEHDHVNSSQIFDDLFKFSGCILIGHYTLYAN